MPPGKEKARYPVSLGLISQGILYKIPWQYIFFSKIPCEIKESPVRSNIVCQDKGLFPILNATMAF